MLAARAVPLDVVTLPLPRGAPLSTNNLAMSRYRIAFTMKII